MLTQCYSVLCGSTNTCALFKNLFYTNIVRKSYYKLKFIKSTTCQTESQHYCVIEKPSLHTDQLQQSTRGMLVCIQIASFYHFFNPNLTRVFEKKLKRASWVFLRLRAHKSHRLSMYRLLTFSKPSSL